MNEASLGKVPSAALADSANALAGHSRFSAVVPDGDDHVVGTFGPFTLHGECIIDDGGTDEAILTLTTSQNNSAMDTNSEDEFEDFDIGDDALVLATTISNPDPEIEGEYDAGLVTHAADGSAYGVDDIMLTINMPNEVGRCHFAGVIEKLS